MANACYECSHAILITLLIQIGNKFVRIPNLLPLLPVLFQISFEHDIGTLLINIGGVVVLGWFTAWLAVDGCSESDIVLWRPLR